MNAIVYFMGTASDRERTVANLHERELRHQAMRAANERDADEEHVQVNASIRKVLKPSLFFYLKQDAKTLSEIVEDFLEAYVEERGGIIGEKKPRRKK